MRQYLSIRVLNCIRLYEKMRLRRSSLQKYVLLHFKQMNANIVNCSCGVFKNFFEKRLLNLMVVREVVMVGFPWDLRLTMMNILATIPYLCKNF